GEKVLLVDDILRTGRKLSELKSLVEQRGGEVVGMAVVVYQPNPSRVDFGTLPFCYLAHLSGGKYYPDTASCDLCKLGVPFERVRL
ncbi:MAG TPA: phosphoribosyltransferase family protein, partial [Bryobacteraceae bacterium]